MKHSEKKKIQKKEYEKPVLRIVNISQGMQTLGVGCKAAARRPRLRQFLWYC